MLSIYSSTIHQISLILAEEYQSVIRAGTELNQARYLKLFFDRFKVSLFRYAVIPIHIPAGLQKDEPPAGIPSNYTEFKQKKK